MVKRITTSLKDGNSESKTAPRRKNKGDIFNELAPEYDTWFDNDGKIIFFTEVSGFKPLLHFLPKPWLEIGVGSGRFAKALGIETGIDPSPEFIRMAKKRGINASVGQGEQSIFNEASVGTVFLIVTLSFLDTPLSVLQEANRILVPNGKIVLGLVLKETPWGRYYLKKKEDGHSFYKYATFYSFDEVSILLKQAGFMTERVVSTLFQKPEEVFQTEEPKEGYFPDAGFTIVLAGKKAKGS